MTDDLTLNMDAYLPLRDVVFNTLREAILKGDLKPGERLMELQLAAKLGVSRTPIREYVRRIATIFQTGRRAYHFAKPLFIFQFNICTCGGTGRRARFRF